MRIPESFPVRVEHATLVLKLLLRQLTLLTKLHLGDVLRRHDDDDDDTTTTTTTTRVFVVLSSALERKREIEKKREDLKRTLSLFFDSRERERERKRERKRDRGFRVLICDI